MLTQTAPKASLEAHIAALQGRHHDLEERIAREQRRPAPDASLLQTLKRRKLLIKDDMTRFEGVLRSLRPRGQAQAAA
jgi:hypothetical protein